MQGDTAPRAIRFVKQQDSLVTSSKLRRAAFVDTAEWVGSSTEKRLVTRADAAQAVARGIMVRSHTTAAARWGLPLVGVSDRTIHTTSVSANPAKSHGDIVRHAAPLPPEDVVMLDGQYVTSLERTVADVIRMLPVEAGLAVMDAALRLIAWDDATHSLREDEAARFHADVERRIRRARGGRGVRNARIVLELADGGAQSPGETITRYRVWELGIPAPVLQMRVETAIGVRYPDIAWPGLRRFTEFDGEVKLYDPRYTAGRTAAEILREQVVRRAAIEDATGWKGFHVGWPDLESATTLWETLRSQGWPLRDRL